MDVLNNNEIEEFLIRRENLDLLEFVVLSEYNSFKKIQTFNHRHEKIRKKDLQKIIPEVCYLVNQELDSDNQDLPLIEYFNILKKPKESTKILGLYTTSATLGTLAFTSLLNEHVFLTTGLVFLAGTAIGVGRALHLEKKEPRYFPEEKRAIIKKGSKQQIIPTLAHEYTHHVQNLRGILTKENNYYTEGQARQIQTIIANKYAEKEKNPTYMLRTQLRNLGEYASTYIWMSEKLNKEPSNSLLRKPELIYNENIAFLEQQQKPTTHAIGNTALRMKKETK